MATIIWASDLMLQPTRKGRIAREVLPRVQQESGHDIVHYAISGLSETMPFPLQGIEVYGTSAKGGTFGVRDFPLVDRRENADVWVLNFDPRPVRTHLQQIDLRYVLYPPVAHEPAARSWEPCLAGATEIVPPCEFAWDILEAAAPDDADNDTVRAPISPGVDPESFEATGSRKRDLLGVAEDTFVVGVFTGTRATRGDFVRQLRAFDLFLEDANLRGDAMLYLHAPTQGQHSFDLQGLLDRLDLGDDVGLLRQGHNRWGSHDRQRPELYNACDVVLHVTGGDAYGLPILESFATETPVIASGWSTMAELVSGTTAEIRHDDSEVEEFVETDRGWLVPVFDDKPTADMDAWHRTFDVEDIAAALTHAYEHPDLRGEKGSAGRSFALERTWDRVAEEWIAYFDGLEERLFETDDDGIEWGQVATEQGGLDALGGDRSDE